MAAEPTNRGGSHREEEEDGGGDSRELYCWTEHPDEPRRKLHELFDIRRHQGVTTILIWQAWHHGLYRDRFAWKEAAFTDVPTHMWGLEVGSQEWKKRRNSDRQLFCKMRWLCSKLDEAVGINTDADVPSVQDLNASYASDAIQGILPSSTTRKG